MSNISDYLAPQDPNEKIFKLTGKPISRSLAVVIDRTSKGLYVPANVVNNIPEVKLGFNIQEKCPESTIDHVNPEKDLERTPLRKSISEALSNVGSFSGYKRDERGNKEPIYNGKVEKGRQIHIVMGLPASGKSTGLVDVVSSRFGAKVLDNDMPKEWIPEYFDGWGTGTVHEEAMKLTDDAMVDSLAAGENIVIPKIGNPPKSLEKILTAIERQNEVFEAAGQEPYKLYVHCMDLDASKTLGRCLNRFAETGRFVDPAWVQSFSDNPNCLKESFETLKNGYINGEGHSFIVPAGTSMWTSDVAYGKDPVLLDYSGDLGDTAFIQGANKDKSAVIGVQEETEEQKMAASLYMYGLTCQDQAELIMDGTDYDKKAVEILTEKKAIAERKLNEILGVTDKVDPDYIHIETDKFMTADEKESEKQKFENSLEKLGEKNEAEAVTGDATESLTMKERMMHKISDKVSTLDSLEGDDSCSYPSL